MEGRAIIVSVGVTIYNSEGTLCKCVDSIINQTYPHLEIILVNDGSSDGSGRICDEYKKRDKRIKVVHQENKGRPGAIQTCIDHATGEYLGFVDSDDWADMNMFEKLVKGATEYDADIVQCGWYRTDGAKSVEWSCTPKQVVFRGREEVLKAVDRYFFHRKDRDKVRFNVFQWNKIIKTGLYKDAAEKYYTGCKLNYCNDGVLLLPVALRSTSIVLIPECLYYFYDANQQKYATRILCLRTHVRGGEARAIACQVICDNDVYGRFHKLVERAWDVGMMQNAIYAMRVVAGLCEPRKEKLKKCKEIRDNMRGARSVGVRQWVFKWLMRLGMFRVVLAIIKR